VHFRTRRAGEFPQPDEIRSGLSGDVEVSAKGANRIDPSTSADDRRRKEMWQPHRPKRLMFPLRMATRRELKHVLPGGWQLERRQILDEFARVTGYHRKHALMLYGPFVPRPGAAA
jgi:hypothetical protein